MAEAPGFLSNQPTIKKMNTTRKNKLGILALAFAAASVSSAFGTQVTLSQGSYQSGLGGEFKATVNGDSLDSYLSSYSQLSTGDAGANTFQTFCIEYNEHFNWSPTAYDVAISGAAVHGGTSTQDTVSVGTGWLYSQFAKGTLSTTAYGSYFTSTTSRKTQAVELQNAIWWLEGEIATSQATNPFILAAEAGLGITHSGTSTVPTVSPGQEGTGLALNTYGGKTAASFGVYALNLGTSPEFPAQDQLIYLKTANQNVPDGGATLLLLGLSLSGMGALQRRMRRTA